MAILSGQYFSVARNRQIQLTAVIPTEVDSEQGGVDYLDMSFPTLYLLHGFTGTHTDWLYHVGIKELSQKHRIAFIMPDGGNSFYLDNEFSGEAVGEFIGHELVDMSRRLFPLSHERNKTFIGGLSMGGYGAIRNALKYNDVFGAAIAFSSAFITDEVSQMKPGKGNDMASYEYYYNTFGNPEKLLGSDRDPKALAKLRKESGSSLPRLYMACGTEDFLFRENQDMHEWLTQLQIEHEWVTSHGAHNFYFWNEALPPAMEWLKAGMNA